MKTFLSTLLLAVSLSLAQAQNYTINLDGLQDGGGARQGTGSGTLTLSGNNLIFNNITYSGLTAPVTIAHIHRGVPGVAGPIVYDLIPANMSSGATSGTITGSRALTAGDITDLNASLLYINIHNGSFPGGEIRGQILPVPEPTTLGLLGLGVLTTLCLVRRKS